MKIYKQHGVALLIFAVILVMLAASVLIKLIGDKLQYTKENEQAKKILLDAKSAVMNHVLLPDTDQIVGRRLGQINIFPDMPVAGHLQYSGTQINNGCILRNWTAGATIVAPNPGSPNSGNARCFGRFPYKSYGVAISASDPADVIGEIPWMIFSNNLTGATYPTDLNTLMLNSNYPGFNNDFNPVPRPWLVVRDARGNIISNRVAIVFIYSGRALANQTSRNLSAHPNQWLDSVTITPSCQMPCVPGTYRNFGFNIGNTQSMEFIQAPDSRLVDANDINYAQPYQFNDVLVYITADEYFKTLKNRADKLKVAGQSPSWYIASGWQNVP